MLLIIIIRKTTEGAISSVTDSELLDSACKNNASDEQERSNRRLTRAACVRAPPRGRGDWTIYS